MVKQIVKDAEAATAQIEAELDLVQSCLNLTRNINGHGVYRERMPVAEFLGVMKNAIDRAQKMLGSTSWPGPADYTEE